MAAKRKPGRPKGSKSKPKQPLPDTGVLVRPLKSDSQGRPRLEITDAGWQMVERMAKALCTQDEIADMLGCSPKTLHTEANKQRFEQIMRSQRAHSLLLVRERQIEKAIAGNPVESIWFGKQHLNQTDRQALTNGQGGPLEVAFAGMDKLEELIEKLEKRKAQEPAQRAG